MLINAAILVLEITCCNFVQAVLALYDFRIMLEKFGSFQEMFDLGANFRISFPDLTYCFLYATFHTI